MKRHNNSGFTLIEILVSLSIVTIVTGLLYGTFRSTINTAEAVEKETDTYRIARIVFYQITKDVSMFYQTAPATSVAGLTPVFGTMQLVGENKTRFIEESNYPDDTLAFMSLSVPPVLQGFSVASQAEISYALTEESLIRNTKFMDKSVKDEVGESALGLNIRYYDDTKKEWIDDWDPRVTRGIPLAMEITLILKGDSPKQVKTFRTTVGIPLAGSL